MVETAPINYTVASTALSEDYGDTWRVLVKPTGDLLGRTYRGVFSPTGNPLRTDDATELTITDHPTSGWFYVSGTAETGGNFRVVTATGEQVTILKGRLTVT